MIVSGMLEIPHNWFLVPYFVILVPFLYADTRWSEVDVDEAIRRRWIWGVTGGAVVVAFMVFNVLNNELAYTRSEGLELVRALLWVRIVYGVVEALLLPVLPVTAVWLAFKSAGMT
jgi:hypothetical protein